MKFSVLISLYNKELPSFLDACLNSIWEVQILKPNEIVLVKDGPLTFELDNIIDKWQERLGSVLKIVLLDKSIGLGKALNEGLKHCSYEWIFRMDTDDICLPNRFKNQLEYINHHPDVVLLGAQVLEFDETMQNTIGVKQVPISKLEIKKFSLKRNPFNHMTVAYRKSIVERVGGYQHHLYMEDYNLWLRIIAEGYEIANLPEILVNVRSGTQMYIRRKGLSYIKSEYILAKLKINLKLQSISMAYAYFFIRALPRFLPSSLLGKLYHSLRQK